MTTSESYGTDRYNEWVVSHRLPKHEPQVWSAQSVVLLQGVVSCAVTTAGDRLVTSEAVVHAKKGPILWLRMKRENNVSYRVCLRCQSKQSDSGRVIFDA